LRKGGLARFGLELVIEFTVCSNGAGFVAADTPRKRRRGFPVFSQAEMAIMGGVRHAWGASAPQ